MAKSKYVWTVDDIEETLNNLYNLKNFDFNSSNYKTLIGDILTLESYLDDYYNQFETGDYPSYIEIYKEYKDILNKYKFLQYDIQMFDEKARYIDIQETELQKKFFI